MTNTNTAREIAVLVSMFSATKPRSCERALAGCPNALRALELEAIALEVAEQVSVAVMNLRDRGISWGAIATTAHLTSRKAKSARARIILRGMARTACRATGAVYAGDVE